MSALANQVFGSFGGRHIPGDDLNFRDFCLTSLTVSITRLGGVRYVGATTSL
jgi:hypothetical protein